MPQRIELSGMRFNFLTVLEMKPSGKRMYVVCKCDCGKTVEVRADGVKAGKVKSCGCYQRLAPLRDGLSGHYLYDTHRGMNRRCYSDSHRQFADYGGRGIQVCAEWRGRDGLPAFVSFVDSVLGDRPEGHTLDRIDNDGNYEPSNVRWASRKEQVSNSRRAK